MSDFLVGPFVYFHILWGSGETALMRRLAWAFAGRLSTIISWADSNSITVQHADVSWPKTKLYIFYAVHISHSLDVRMFPVKTLVKSISKQSCDFFFSIFGLNAVLWLTDSDWLTDWLIDWLFFPDGSESQRCTSLFTPTLCCKYLPNMIHIWAATW